MSLESINPATGEVIETIIADGEGDIDAKLELASVQFRAWRAAPIQDRLKLLNAVADTLDAKIDQLARALTQEMGKPISQARGEIKKCAWVCRHYAELAPSYLEDEALDSDAKRSFVRHLPMGPVLAVMPWNFPFWQVFRFAAPAIAAGNVGLLKHASNTPRSAVLIQEVFENAGAPKGVFQSLMIGSSQVSRVIKDHRVVAATLTGSEKAGAAVAAVAGEQIKPRVLELGGSDPFIVMASADFDAALDAAVTSRTINNGQSCIAAKRFLVHSDIYQRFRDGFVARFEALKVGDPLDDYSDIGPLATEQTRNDIRKQVRSAVDQGGQRATGADVMDGPGFYFRPGIIEGLPQDAAIGREELFGPVALLERVDSLDAAIARANATPFGLGSAIWSQDDAEIEKAINGIEAGATFVNAFVASDPRLPFGGVKTSGYGRELARDGILAFVNRKTVSIS